MQIEELQDKWRQMDFKLDRSLRMNRELLRQTVVRSNRNRLTIWMVWPSIDIAASLFVAIFAMAFIWDHLDSLGLVLSAGVVLFGAIALCVSSIRQLAILSEVDWSSPVVSLQRTLASLRLAQTRQVFWILLSSPIVGFCGLMVFLQWMLDFLPEPHFILEKLSQRWIWSNMIFGVLVLVLGYWAARILGQRFGSFAWWKSLEDALAGKAVMRAQRELDQLKGLEEEI